MISPGRTVTIAGVDHELSGSFETLRALHDRYRNLVQLPTQIIDMDFFEMGEFIAITTGKPKDGEAITKMLMDKVGLSDDFLLLQIELNGWMNTVLSPESLREKKSADLE